MQDIFHPIFLRWKEETVEKTFFTFLKIMHFFSPYFLILLNQIVEDR